MTAPQEIASILLVTAGIFAMFIGSMGIVRLPDFYTRTHAVSMSDTLGILLVITGLIIYEGMTINSLKLFFIVLFVMLSNPIGTHALARAAYRRGVWPLFNPAAEGGGERPGGHRVSGSVNDAGGGPDDQNRPGSVNDRNDEKGLSSEPDRDNENGEGPKP